MRAWPLSSEFADTKRSGPESGPGCQVRQLKPTTSVIDKTEGVVFSPGSGV
jgi:hypothetical protein